MVHAEWVKLPLALVVPPTPPYPDIPAEVLDGGLVDALVDADADCASCCPDMSWVCATLASETTLKSAAERTNVVFMANSFNTNSDFHSAASDAGTRLPTYVGGHDPSTGFGEE